MSRIPPPLVEQDDELVPITACITQAQVERLELVLARYRNHHPRTDDNHVIDAIFIAGLQAAERLP